MFDLAFTEIAVIAVLAIIIIKPEDMPAMLRGVGKAMGKVKEVSNEWAKMLDEVKEESGVNEVNQELQQIVGDDGTLYEAYPLDDLEAFLPNKDEPPVQVDDAKGDAKP